MNEQNIHQRMLQGDTSALEELMDAYGDCVYKLVARILQGACSSNDIEECCSDAFMAAWEKKNRFDPARGNLRTWVLILARYRALDYRRANYRHKRLEAEDILTDIILPETGPEDRLLQLEMQTQVIAALELLPKGEKEILYRRYFLDESIDRIAADLGLSRGAVDNRLWRARKSMKKALDGHDRKVVQING